MVNFFVPYVGERPASLTINGHIILILGQERENMMDGLEVIGGDHIEELQVGDSQEEQATTLNQIAQSTHAGVVIAPGDVELGDLIQSLKGQLPWVQ